jgi:hypothetical protein
MTSKTTTKAASPRTSRPDAQGRVAHKIDMTTAAAQLPSSETDARRAAELIYCSAIKKHGNP